MPGGIGMTAWLNQTYSALGPEVIGGADGMLRGFAGIFGQASCVHLVISEESSTYRPEMNWLSAQLGHARFKTQDARFTDVTPGDAVYRFFELFDLPNVPGAHTLFTRAQEKEILLTPPPKPIFEEKMMFGLLWNRNLRPFWRQQLGESFFERLLKNTPYTWIVDPAPMPPHAAIPDLNLTDWAQLKTLSQRERDLIKPRGHPDAAGHAVQLADGEAGVREQNVRANDARDVALERGGALQIDQLLGLALIQDSRDPGRLLAGHALAIEQIDGAIELQEHAAQTV